MEDVITESAFNWFILRIELFMHFIFPPDNTKYSTCLLVNKKLESSNLQLLKTIDSVFTFPKSDNILLFTLRRNKVISLKMPLFRLFKYFSETSSPSFVDASNI
jgi:hypothetical protein